jgi:hypothetical protein
MKPPEAVKNSNDDYARFWGVTPRTVRNWQADGIPFRDPEEMAKAMARAKNVPPGVRAKLDELGMSAAKAKAAEKDPHWVQFDKDWKAGLYTPEKNVPERLSKLCYFHAYKLERCLEVSDDLGAKLYNGLYKDLQELTRKLQLAAEKLGIETGETMRRPDIERIEEARTLWTMAANDRAVAVIVDWILANRNATAKQAKDHLESILLSARIVEPHKRATRTKNELSLPAWYVEAMERGVKQFLKT